MNIDYGDLFNPDKSINKLDLKEKELLIPAFLKTRGLFNQHISSFNYFLNTEIKKIIKAKVNNSIRSDVDPEFYLKYNDIRIKKPKVAGNFEKERQLYPNECRIRDMSYLGHILVDIEYYHKKKKVIQKNIKIGEMPIMWGSDSCWLKDKTPDELAELQECIHDPRGYFIIKGVEKVVLMQEQMAKNKILLEFDSKLDTLVASCASSTLETKSKILILIKNNKIYLKSNSFNELIPIVIIFKAMGYEDEQEIIESIIENNLDFSEKLILSFEDSSKNKVYTQNEALKYLSDRIKNQFKSLKISNSKIEEAKEVLAYIILAHIPCHRFNFTQKFIFLCLMVRRLIKGLLDKTLCDDKDYAGNKRIEAAGHMLGLLFEDLFKKYNNELKKEFDKIIYKIKKDKNKNYEFEKLMPKENIKAGLVSSLSSGNWSIKRFKIEKKGVTQVLNRISFTSCVGMMTRIESYIEKTRKISGPRALQPSHWGMLCPSDTPDGENCGLVKNMSLLTHITTEEEIKPIYFYCLKNGMIELSNIQGKQLSLKNIHILFINGVICGVILDSKKFIKKFQIDRRNSKIKEFVSISLDINNNFINILCDGGRLTRPLIIVENEKPKLTNEHIKLIKEDKIEFNDLIKKGVIEFIDVLESDNCLIAINENNICSKTTHLEIKEHAIIGLIAGVIPFPHHNQSPRNTYQCAMGKQAIGAGYLNNSLRVDTINFSLVYPQQPLVKTQTIDIMKYNKLPAGHNAVIAVMSYSGYDLEDAVILNKESIQRGFGSIIYKKRFITNFERNGIFEDNLIKPNRNLNNNDKKYFNDIYKDKIKLWDNDGLAKVGSKIEFGNIYVNKEKHINENEKINAPVSYNNNISSYVERVIITNNNYSKLLIKNVFSHVRYPEIGDKFSSRHGQKGVVGLIVPQVDLPFSETGIIPDIIMNPHGFPSRMTVGKLIELIAGKSGSLEGRYTYGDAFCDNKNIEFSRLLIKNGYSYNGKDCLYSGINGELMNVYIFTGPIFYQRLKHLVADKIHSRSTGKKQILTRQPLEGRAKQGGLRLGEMERDCLIAYGTSNLMLERFKYSSDEFITHFCQKCNLFTGKNYCYKCDILSRKISVPYPFKLLMQELIALGINPKIKLN